MENMERSDGKVASLQALRALAFLGIFLAHAGAQTLQWPQLGVSVFFVLSGFLMYYHYDSKTIVCSVKENAFFSWKKVKRLYPLHILTMCMAVILELAVRIHGGFSIGDLVYVGG